MQSSTFATAITMHNSEPFTHTGVLVFRPIEENVTVYGGWTAGWDTGCDQLHDSSSWFGGASLTLTDNASPTYILTDGDFDWRRDRGYSHSVVLDTMLSDNNLHYVL